MPKINYKILKSNIESKNFSNLYYLFGNENYLINYYTKKIIKNSVDSENGFNVAYFNIKEENFKKISDFLEIFPVNSSKKCIVLTNFENIQKENFDFFIKLISDIPDFSILIIQNYSKNINEKSDNYKSFIAKVLEIGIIVEFLNKNLPVEKQAIVWAKSLGKTLSFQNAKLLSDICQRDLNLIKNNLEKICFSENNNEISENKIKKIHKDIEYNVFEIDRAIEIKNYSLAFKIIKNLILQKTEPIGILSAISSKFIDIYRIKCAKQQNIDVEKLIETFDYKGKEFKITKAERKSQDFSIEKIGKIIEFLIDADILLKTTRISSSLLLDETIAKLILC
ncbi:MAG: DNA polymerase III subunit delta [Oscillospiraceae bacterium]|jgi:DNA polymerase-3 subunit delta|nr:DNA polymerase III subunit delta [Oscillospiraceae bacterium]